MIALLDRDQRVWVHVKHKLRQHFIALIYYYCIYFIVILKLPGIIKYSKNASSYHVWRELAEVEITPFVHSAIHSEIEHEYMIVREGMYGGFIPSFGWLRKSELFFFKSTRTRWEYFKI